MIELYKIFAEKYDNETTEWITGKCIEQEVKVIWQKAPHGGPIPRLGVTQGVESCTIEFLG